MESIEHLLRYQSNITVNLLKCFSFVFEVCIETKSNNLR